MTGYICNMIKYEHFVPEKMDDSTKHYLLRLLLMIAYTE